MLLIAAGRAAQRRLEIRLAEHELTLRHVGALGHLSSGENLSYSDLARRANVTPQSMHATMTQLAERGAITIENRGRAVYATLTEHGLRLLRIAADIAAELDRAGVDDVADAAMFRRSLVNIARRGAAR